MYRGVAGLHPSGKGAGAGRHPVLQCCTPCQPSPRSPTCWEVVTPFFSLLTGRKGLSSMKVHPNRAAGYLERAAPIPGRGRAAASGGLDVFFLIAGQALSPAKQHVSHFL